MTRVRAKILMAEDNPGDIFLVRRALEKHNIDVDLVVVQDGQAALRLIERADMDESVACPDLVLLDLNLPRATGGRILERMRQSPKYASTPIIVITSSDSPMDRAAAAQFGAAHYFQKPSDLAAFMELGEIIRNLLPKAPAATKG